jgi:cytochrome b pre-mRNA-processing protein 3
VILRWLFGRRRPDPSEALYAAIVAAARQEKFYAQWGVPDTLNGRFDMMVLHTFLVMERLRDFGSESEELSQALINGFFAQMDAALREVGVGDLVVGKKVRKMAEAYFGRATAYAKALADDDTTALAEAVARNVYAGTDAKHAADVAQWARLAKAALKQQALAELAQGQVRFE